MKNNNKGKGKVIRTTIFLVLLVVVLCFLCIPLFKNLKFGLDLQGGFEILYKVESIDGSKMTHDKIMATYKTLSKRIDSLGVTEPEITIEGNDKIRVKLAGVTNPEEARKQLSTVATLSFRDSEDNLLMTSDVLVSGGAKVSQDSSGNPAVSLSVKDKEEFYKVTNKVKDYDQNLIVIWLDYNENEDSYASEGSLCGTEESNCLSAATVSQGFASDVIIQGNFTEEQVENLVDLINSGSLPSKLTEISSQTVGASFGDNTLQTTFIAGVIGIVLIILFLIAVYHFAGFISAVSMMIYAFLVFLVFWVVGGVLTLPGIAALILGIGTAVDSSIITFARIKDELYKGKSLPMAFREGSKESFSAILDANVTTLLVAIIMFVLGESSIKGFATMQIITVAVIMVTMVGLNRLLLKLFVKTNYFNDKTKLFINVKTEDIPDVSKNEETKVVPFKNFNFFKYTKQFVGLSIIILVFGVVMFFVQGLNLSVEYQSGSDIAIVTKEDLTEKKLNEDLKKLDLEKRDIEITKDETNILVNNVLEGDEVDKVTNYFEEKYDAQTNIGAVSNIVQQELVKNAIISVLLSLLGIILYISVRFKFSYAVGGVVSLFHDVLFIFALFIIFRLQISTMFIAAILAIIGYSINDTIVTFDRIREELANVSEKKMTKETVWKVTNRAVCETFIRTLHTFLSTLIPIVILIFLGSKEILTFNLAMLFGFIAGAYSSIYIAAVIFAAIEAKNIGKPKKTKVIYTDEYEEKQIKGINC
ncbi:MAG: protein translocase subunit SecD [bacterium]|nr:protein translocase subunit SecD [Mycoplasmatota bacterium]MDD6756579.1 protein translocase subunit SecD [bacterium]MDY2908111.1 protein translocase subunit SecD [Candidatus Faecimonas sp.]